MNNHIYHCDKHGEIQFEGTSDFIGDEGAVTLYCPKCHEESQSELNRIKIKRVDKTLPLPEYQTNGSVAFDIYTRVETLVKRDEIVLIPTNLIIQVPKGYMLMITLRSSTPKKYLLTMPHGIGIIDQDYCGDEDEIMLQVMGIQPDTLQTIVARGERIAQGIFVPIFCHEKHWSLAIWPPWQEVDSMDASSRGGFGSTDDQK